MRATHDQLETGEPKQNFKKSKRIDPCYNFLYEGVSQAIVGIK